MAWHGEPRKEILPRAFDPSKLSSIGYVMAAVDIRG